MEVTLWSIRGSVLCEPALSVKKAEGGVRTEIKPKHRKKYPISCDLNNKCKFNVVSGKQPRIYYVHMT